jgi:hypothetical protein
MSRPGHRKGALGRGSVFPLPLRRGAVVGRPSFCVFHRPSRKPQEGGRLEDTYARWLTRTDERLRAAFDSYDTREFGGQFGGRRPLKWLCG